MKPRHILLALLVAVIWGFNFVVIRIGLGSFAPLLLAALRFILAALPALLLPRPPVPWPRMLAIGLTLFVGQFAFLFPAMRVGMPPGLKLYPAATVAPFSLLVPIFGAGSAALVLGEQFGPARLLGIALILLGLAAAALPLARLPRLRTATGSS